MVPVVYSVLYPWPKLYIHPSTSTVTTSAESSPVPPKYQPSIPPEVVSRFINTISVLYVLHPTESDSPTIYKIPLDMAILLILSLFSLPKAFTYNKDPRLFTCIRSMSYLPPSERVPSEFV